MNGYYNSDASSYVQFKMQSGWYDPSSGKDLNIGGNVYISSNALAYMGQEETRSRIDANMGARNGNVSIDGDVTVNTNADFTGNSSGDAYTYSLLRILSGKSTSILGDINSVSSSYMRGGEDDARSSNFVRIDTSENLYIAGDMNVKSYSYSSSDYDGTRGFFNSYLTLSTAGDIDV